MPPSKVKIRITGFINNILCVVFVDNLDLSGRHRIIYFLPTHLLLVTVDSVFILAPATVRDLDETEIAKT